MGYANLLGNIKAIVHTCNFQSFKEGRSGSVLIQSWRLLSYHQQNGKHNYLYYPFIDVVDLESIHGIAFVVEEYPGIHGRIDLGIIGEHKHTYDSVLNLLRLTSAVLIYARNTPPSYVFSLSFSLSCLRCLVSSHCLL